MNREIDSFPMSKMSKLELYAVLHDQWEGLQDPSVDWISNLSNAAALLKSLFNFWWVGFYRIQNNELHLGPFQGPPACTKIAYGNGVCGRSWENQKSIVVDNVDLFPGHIACSTMSKSEIVIPIYCMDGSIWGVLDLDSQYIAHFDSLDQMELEKFCRTLRL